MSDIGSELRRFDELTLNLLRVSIGVAVKRDLPHLSPSDVERVQSVVMNQLCRFGV